MLRMYFVQQWYALADEAVEDAIYDLQALRNFMSIDLSQQSVPDATTLMAFRHLLEAHDLTKAILVEVMRDADRARPPDDPGNTGGRHLDCRAQLDQEQEPWP